MAQNAPQTCHSPRFQAQDGTKSTPNVPLTSFPSPKWHKTHPKRATHIAFKPKTAQNAPQMCHSPRFQAQDGTKSIPNVPFTLLLSPRWHKTHPKCTTHIDFKPKTAQNASQMCHFTPANAKTALARNQGHFSHLAIMLSYNMVAKWLRQA